MKKIISLTSFPARINYVKHTIVSLIDQNITADKIVLYLGADKFPNKEKDIPEDLLKLVGEKFEIHWIDHDLRSFTKLIPALKEYPDDIIITADDDIIYSNNWLELLYQSYLKNPELIHCHRAHEITFRNGKINSYNNWNKSVAVGVSYNNFLTGVGGVLYPPHILHKDVFNEDLFKTLCPYADDIWFWTMAVLNNVKIKVVDNNISTLKTVDGSQDIEECLFKQNVTNNRNDVQLQAVLDKYGASIYDKLSHITANNYIIRKYFLGLQIFKFIETQRSKRIFLFGICFFEFFKHTNEKILVHFHLYYLNQLSYFLKKLKNITCNYDLYVTTPIVNNNVIKKLKKIKPDVNIVKVENLGYDVFPFLFILYTIDLDKYDYVLKIHTKNYRKHPWVYKNKKYRGYQWRNELVNFLIGSKKQFNKCLDLMKTNNMIGSTRLLRTKENLINIPTTKKICKILQIKHTNAPFICGTMFLISAKKLKTLQQHKFSSADFSGQQQTGSTGTFAHSMETVFGIIANDTK